MTLVDSNVLLDVVTQDPQWLEWSVQRLNAAAARGPILASDITYAEISARFPRAADVDAFLDGTDVQVLPVPKPGLFLAGRAFRAYRARGGTRTSLLPDFLIGAHAAAGLPLLTRDVARYRTYFPTVMLIVP